MEARDREKKEHAGEGWRRTPVILRRESTSGPADPGPVAWFEASSLIDSRRFRFPFFPHFTDFWISGCLETNIQI